MSETDFNLDARKSPAVPQFFTESIKHEYRSQQEGRPIFIEREMVRIIIPGDRRSMAVEIVGEEHKARWPAAYAAFRQGLEAPLEGTPLREWPHPLMTSGRAEELAFFNIKTVQQMAAVNDAQLQNLGMGTRELREAAKVWLEVAQKGSAPIARLMAENDRLTAEVTRLTAQLTQANAETNALRAQMKEPAHARA